MPLPSPSSRPPVAIPAPAPSRPQPRKPGLRRACPERHAAQLAARDVLTRLVDEGRITVRELAECWQCPVSHAFEKLQGERPIHLAEIFLLPDPLPLSVLADASAVVRDRRQLRLAHR